MDWSILVVLLSIFIFQALTILILEIKHPSKAVAWLFILYVFPVVGFVMYYFLAQEYQKRRQVRKKVSHYGQRPSEEEIRDTSERLLRDYPISRYPRLLGLLLHMPDAPVSERTLTEVLANGEAVFSSMIQAMLRARDHIHLETYILRDDQLGSTFADLLIDKARAGVEVRLICDGVGSYKLSEEYVAKLRTAGIRVHFFLPPRFALFDKRINYRNHRKIMVVDGTVGFVGGINIGDEYLGANPKFGFWRDTHLRLEGEAVHALQQVFLNDWSFASGERVSGKASYFPASKPGGEHPVQIIPSGPDTHRDTILEVFFTAIAGARHRLWLTTPYFIPDDSTKMALKTAAISGVDVRVIVPKKPDSIITHWASKSYIAELLHAGVRFFFYTKGFLHAKTLLADDMLATVGTANFDMRSFFSNFELNALLFDRQSIEKVEQDLIEDMEHSVEIRLADFERRTKLDRFKERLARMFSPLL